MELSAMLRVSWSVEFHPECEKWADALDRDDTEALLAAICILRDETPSLRGLWSTPEV
jgi:hypothetical protein